MKQPMKMVPAEFSTVVWHWVSPAGQTMIDILEPAYWQHVTSQLRPGHEIKVVSEDRTFWAHLLVRNVGKQEALVGTLAHTDFTAASKETGDSDTFIKWRGPKAKFGVLRTADNEVLHDGFETKEAALDWIETRAMEMAA